MDKKQAHKKFYNPKCADKNLETKEVMLFRKIITSTSEKG